MQVAAVGGAVDGGVELGVVWAVKGEGRRSWVTGLMKSPLSVGMPAMVHAFLQILRQDAVRSKQAGAGAGEVAMAVRTAAGRRL